MPAVFVHGVPETAELWDGVRSRIDGESVALALPGFGNPRPDGFGATKDEYAAWVLEQLGEIDGPIDLVGHDWGALLAIRIATTHGGLLHSWVADVANVLHADYVWHEFAQIWQTPGQGEEFMDSQLAAPDDARGEVFIGFGVPEPEARKLGQCLDHTMSRCILDLYRSAVPNAAKDWGADVKPTDAAGMLLARDRRSVRERGDRARHGATTRRSRRDPRRPGPLVDVAGSRPGRRGARRVLEVGRLNRT